MSDRGSLEDPGRGGADAVRVLASRRQPRASRHPSGRGESSGAALAVLPEMFNTGYGLLPDFGPSPRGPTGRRCGTCPGAAASGGWGSQPGSSSAMAGTSTTRWPSACPMARSRSIASGTWSSGSGSASDPGGRPLVVPTPWGRIGLAICADMIYRHVWDDYRGQIDLGVIASAWPEFACRHSGRKHWLFGRLGPLSAEIPAKVARDLDIPVIFVNQCGATRTTIPLLGLRLAQQIDDRFAGRSSICDGRNCSAGHRRARTALVLSEVILPNPRGPRSWRSTSPSVPAVFSSGSA